jgi:hypothetical protein
MPGFFNLAVNVRNAFFRSLPMPKFLGLVTGKLMAGEEILGSGYSLEDVAEFHRQARFAFFDRQHLEAYRYQSSLINSWMISFSQHKKLPFIENDADRREWLNVLEHCVNDPFRPLVNKIHACLLINALFPTDEDLHQCIVIGIMDQLSTNTGAYQNFKAYASLLDPGTINILLLRLKTELELPHPVSRRERAAMALVELMRYLPKNEQGELQQRFIKQWKEAHIDTIGHAAEVLCGMVWALSKEEKDQAFERCKRWLLSDLNGFLYFKLARFAITLVPVLNNEQKRAVFDLSYPVINGVMTDLNRGFTQFFSQYVDLLFRLAPQLSEAHTWELLSEDKHPAAHLQLALAASLSPAKKEQLLVDLVAALECDAKAISQAEINAFNVLHHRGDEKAKLIAGHRRRIAAILIRKFLPSLSEEDKKTATAVLFPKLKDPDREVAKAVAETLAHCGAYLAKQQILLLVDFAYTHSDYANFHALDFLAPLTPYLEDPELKRIEDRFTPLYYELPHLAHTLLRIREINQTPAPVGKPVRFFRSPAAAQLSSAFDASSTEGDRVVKRRKIGDSAHTPK